ncbi:MAG: PilZ domain-containing protein, partial [Gammaproteobacteria bacterium]|nr:PilZ domain-containing protein [Gammaproteobacteria bacterium]
LPIDIGGLPLFTTNISFSGAQISCPNMMLGIIKRDLEAKSLSLDLKLPSNSTARINCAVIYVSDYADEYLIGLHFSRFEDDGDRLLKEYFLEISGPEYFV